MSIKKIIILPRVDVEKAIKSQFRLSETGCALISIWSAEELVSPDMNLKKLGCSEVLSIRFADLTLQEHKRLESDSKLFGVEEAKTIINFVDKVHKIDVPELIIHCVAGISRSPAVGLWACRYLGLDEKEIITQNKILPNIYVMSVLNEVSGINEEYLKFWVSKEIREKIFRRML
jgi:predicted protein tyrosine phosphatase